MADNFDPTYLSAEREASIKELHEMLLKSSEVIKQIKQYYVGTNAYLDEEKKLFMAREEILKKELGTLQKFGRSTYEKELEIQEKRMAFDAASETNERINIMLNSLKKYDLQEADLKKEGVNVRAALEKIYTTDKETVDDMLTLLKEHGHDMPEINKLLESQSKDNADQFILTYINALKASAQHDGVEALKAQQQSRAYVTDTFKMTKNLATSMLHVNDYSNSLAMNLLTVSGSVSSMLRGFKDMLNPMNLAMNLAMKMALITKEMVFSFDKMYAAYARGGGMIEMDKDMLMGASVGVRSEGISEEVVGRSGEALHSFYSDFSMLNEKARTELTQTAARLETLGVSASTYAGLMNTLTNSLGKTWQESNAILLDLEKSGREIGVSSKKTFEDWKSSLSILSMYGEKAQNVFKGLQREAKKTGIEMQTLLSLEEKFLTFDNAAEFAGKMAAIAGKNVIDPIKLMMATDEKKFEMVKSALQAANIKDPRGIMYMAKGLGLNPAQVKALMDTTSQQQAPERGAKGFQEVVQMSITLADKFKNALKALAVAVSPLLKVLGGLASVIQWLSSVWDGWLVRAAAIVFIGYKIFGIWTKLIAAYRIAGSVLGMFKAVSASTTAAEIAGIKAKSAALAQQTLIIKANVAVSKGLVAVQTVSTPAMAGFTAAMTALSAGAVGMLAFGVMLVLVAAAFWIFSYALQGFAKAAGMATLEQWFNLSIGIIMLGASFAVFAVIMSFVTPLLLFAAPAILTLIGLLAVLSVTVPSVAPQLIVFAEGLTVLGIAFVGFVFRMIRAGAAIALSFGLFSKGFKAFKGAVSSVSSAMKELSVETINAFNTMLVNLINLSSKSSVFATLADGIWAMVDAMVKLQFLMSAGLGDHLTALYDFSMGAGGGVVDTIKAVGSLDDSQIKNYENLVKVTERLVEVTKNNETDKVSRMINATREAVQQNSSAGMSMPKEIIVKCILKDREIAEVVVPLVRESVFGTSLLNKS